MKPVVLVLVARYHPGFKAGGPVRSVVNMVDHLRDDFDFRIVTTDRDLGDAQPYDSVRLGEWTSIDGATVFYASPSSLMSGRLIPLIRGAPHDIVYINSFFSPAFTIQPLVARRLGLIPRRPAVLAPRGEFSRGALALKALKKRAWIEFARRTGLLSDLSWQASSEFEVTAIREALDVPVRSVHVARNLGTPTLVTLPAHLPRRADEPLRIIFLSRISPIKNLDYALRVIERVRSPVAFEIYGPHEDRAYYELCMGLASGLPSRISVRWHGAVLPADIPAILAKYDVLFLPSRGENFGHVIAESLAAGTPVLISDATPWRGLAAAGVGDDLPLSEPEAFVARIETMAAMSSEMALAQRAAAAAYARRRQQDSRDVEANRNMFLAALRSS